MIINNLRLFVFLLILLVTQFSINNFTIMYVDLFGILLLISLLSGSYSWHKMVIFSLIADIFGHWYLGTHLVTIVLVSLLAPNMINFYRMSGWFQRSLITNLYFIIFNLIICVIDLVLSKTHLSISGFIFEILIVMPVIQLLLDKFIIQKNNEFIWYG